MSTTTTNSSATTDKAQELLDSLAAQVETLRTSEGWLAWLEVAKRFHTYSANNQLLIWLQRPDATHVMGYGAKDGSTGWLSLGRQVRKGERGISILAPVVRKRTVDDEETGEKKVIRYVAGFRGVAVFDISQTDGEPLPASPADLWREALAEAPADAPEAQWSALAIAADKLGLTVTLEDGHADGALGWHVRNTREVHVVQGSWAQMTATLAHEMSHALDPGLKEGTYAENELVAESSAFIISDALGVAAPTVTTTYLAGFGGDADKLQALAGRIVKLAQGVIEALEEVAAS